MTATLSQLKSIFSSSLTDDTLTMFLNAAIELGQERLLKSGFAESRKDMIILNLAAHFASAAEPRLESESSGDRSYHIQGKTGMNLQGTLYGQQALALDTSGSLAKLGNKVSSFQVIGRQRSV